MISSSAIQPSAFPTPSLASENFEGPENSAKKDPGVERPAVILLEGGQKVVLNSSEDLPKKTGASRKKRSIKRKEGRSKRGRKKKRRKLKAVRYDPHCGAILWGPASPGGWSGGGARGGTGGTKIGGKVAGGVGEAKEVAHRVDRGGEGGTGEILGGGVGGVGIEEGGSVTFQVN